MRVCSTWLLGYLMITKVVVVENMTVDSSGQWERHRREKGNILWDYLDGHGALPNQNNGGKCKCFECAYLSAKIFSRSVITKTMTDLIMQTLDVKSVADFLRNKINKLDIISIFIRLYLAKTSSCSHSFRGFYLIFVSFPIVCSNSVFAGQDGLCVLPGLFSRVQEGQLRDEPVWIL